MRANLKSISHICHLFKVAFVWELSKKHPFAPGLPPGWCNVLILPSRVYGRRLVTCFMRASAWCHPAVLSMTEKELLIGNLLVRIHFIIETIWWTGLAPWELEFPFPGSRTSTFLAPLREVFSSCLRMCMRRSYVSHLQGRLVTCFTRTGVPRS